MQATTTNWKTLLTVLVGGAMLLLASLQMAVGRPSPAKPQPAAMAPLAEPPREPISNEISDFPQLG